MWTSNTTTNESRIKRWTLLTLRHLSRFFYWWKSFKFTQKIPVISSYSSNCMVFVLHHFLFEPSRAYIFPFAPMQPRAVEPGLKQDWNLKLNLERQTTDRLTRVPVSQQASTGGIIYCLVLTDIECRLLPWIGVRVIALLEYTLSVESFSYTLLYFKKYKLQKILASLKCMKIQH